MMQERDDKEQDLVSEKQLTLEQILASQPLNPLRQLEFCVLPLSDNYEQPA